MPSFSDVVHRHTRLSDADVLWLRALVADWQLLADLSFADLVLWVDDLSGEGYRAIAQMRPTTGPTSYSEDLVGSFLKTGRRPLVDAAFTQGVIARDADPQLSDDIPVRVEAIPVRREGRIIAVIARHTNLVAMRTPSRLELSYVECGRQLAVLITEGRFPNMNATNMGRRGAPRVGDGLIHIDADGAVIYASPNAMSTYRRMGLTTDLVGNSLNEVTAGLLDNTVDADSLESRFDYSQHHRVELVGSGTVVAFRVIPLNPGGVLRGALVLCRDVTEIRRRERELVTKDATIREIHHRVKNNLQTVASLLRLQARRIADHEGRAALTEAVQRVAVIAMVHETLAETVDGPVPFDDVVDRLLAMSVDVASTDVETKIHYKREGSFGTLPADVAAALASVLTEIMHNAVEHGLRNGGQLTVSASRASDRLHVVVEDNGQGMPVDFDSEKSGKLGLQIVRTLVIEQLGGTYAIARRDGGGTRAEVTVALPAGTAEPGH